MSNIEAYERAIKARQSEAVMQMIAEDPKLAEKRIAGGLTSIMLAAYNGAWDLVRWLSEEGYVFGLSDAVLTGDAEMVNSILMLHPGALNEYNADGFTPLHVAAYFGKDPITIQLVERGANLAAQSKNELKNTPLQAAIAGSSRDDVIALMIAKGAPLDGEGYSPLQLAAENGRPAVIRMLLEKGADPKATTPDGKTAVDLATAAGHSELVELLG